MLAAGQNTSHWGGSSHACVHSFVHACMHEALAPPLSTPPPAHPPLPTCHKVQVLPPNAVLPHETEYLRDALLALPHQGAREGVAEDGEVGEAEGGPAGCEGGGGERGVKPSFDPTLILSVRCVGWGLAGGGGKGDVCEGQTGNV
jgi:hypothetical protein